MATTISRVKKCGDSYEVEWISYGSAGLLRPPRMDNQLLLSSLAAMFFVTNASLDMTEKESKYTGVRCITCNYCSSGMEWKWKLNEERSCYEEPSLSHFALHRHDTVTHLLCERKWSIVTGEGSCSFTEPEAILFLCHECGYGNRK